MQLSTAAYCTFKSTSKKMADRDIYDSLYFRMNKKHLRFVSLWPYDSQKAFVPLLWMSFNIILNYPHFAGVIVNMSNVDRLLEHSIIMLSVLAQLTKYLTIFISQSKIKTSLDDIANIWSMITDEEEKKILTEYSKLGRILTLGYLGLLVAVATLFILLPLVPEILNIVDPLSVPRPHISILNGEFLLANPEDYFVLIYLCDIASVFCTCLNTHAIDTMYMVCVEQGRALYAILSYRLSKLQCRTAGDSAGDKDGSYERMVHAIKLHQIILSYVNNINDALSLCFIGLTVMNLFALPISCVVVLIHLKDPMNFVRWAFAVVTFILHLFVQFWPGQKISQAGNALVKDAYQNDWYETPAKTKKLLRILMVRCSQPPLIMAGGLVEMNFETYSKVMRVAASYVTVLASFR